MTNSSVNIPGYLKQLSMEATFQSSEDQDIYIYGYVTYDKTKLKGPQIDKIKNYNINAFGRIPISENEFLDMSLITEKGNKLLDFHMTYVRNFTDKDDDTLLGMKFKQHIRTLNIRTDIGPHKGSPHIDVEIFDVDKKRVFDEVVKQDNEFSNYESAISAVLMQAERLSNPLIGAQYWLSPTQIFPKRVEMLAKLREQSKISTSLSILSRVINVRAYEKTRGGIIIDERQFWDIVEFCIELTKGKEKELGGKLEVEIPYSTEMSALPFLFFAPEKAEYSFKAYRSDGSEIRTEGIRCCLGEDEGSKFHKRL
jgi:hypothetical protein